MFDPDMWMDNTGKHVDNRVFSQTPLSEGKRQRILKIMENFFSCPLLPIENRTRFSIPNFQINCENDEIIVISYLKRDPEFPHHSEMTFFITNDENNLRTHLLKMIPYCIRLETKLNSIFVEQYRKHSEQVEKNLTYLGSLK